MKEIVGKHLINELEDKKMSMVSSYNKNQETYLKKAKQKLTLLDENDKLKSGKSIDGLKNRVSHVKRIIKRRKEEAIKQFTFKETIALGITTIVASLSGLILLSSIGAISATATIFMSSYKQFKNSILKSQKELSDLHSRIKKIKENETEIDILTNELKVIQFNLNILKEEIKVVTNKISEAQNNSLIELNNKFQNSKFNSTMKGRYNNEKGIIEVYPVQDKSKVNSLTLNNK